MFFGEIHLGAQKLVMSCASVSGKVWSLYIGGCYNSTFSEEFGFDGVIPLVKGCHVLVDVGFSHF